MNLKLATYISHYFEKEVGPLLSICDLDVDERQEIIDREKDAKTGFNRFSYGKEFFDFRLLADDLLIELYEKKFGYKPRRRPFYAVLGEADVVGGLYRNPYKIQIPIDHFNPTDLTFMCPDHFHLVGLNKNTQKQRMFGVQIPNNYTESEFPYFGKLLTHQELIANYHTLKIDQHIDKQQEENGWYRYIEAQIWSTPETILQHEPERYEVTPEPWTLNGVTHLQNLQFKS